MSGIPHVEDGIIQQNTTTRNPGIIPGSIRSYIQDRVIYIFCPGETIGRGSETETRSGSKSTTIFVPHIVGTIVVNYGTRGNSIVVPFTLCSGKDYRVVGVLFPIDLAIEIK
jgi:hypothetical protein